MKVKNTASTLSEPNISECGVEGLWASLEACAHIRADLRCSERTAADGAEV